MELKILNIDETAEIYNSRMTIDFPECELKPLESIIDMHNRNCYDPLIIINDQSPIGYAFVTKVPNTNYVLLDYFAIFSEFRNKKYGSTALLALKQYFSNSVIFIESENPVFQTNKEIPEKRVRFYERNECVNTGVESVIWGVHYINYYLSNEVLNKETCRNALIKIYETMVENKELRNKFVKID